MYNEYFRFNSFPFLNTADPGFWFNSYTHREALAVLVYGIREGKGLTVITGGVGTGKTMLVAALRAESGEQDLFVEISSPWVSSDEVFASIWHDIGLPVPRAKEPPLLSKPGALKTLKERLIQLSDEGRRVVLVVDEAHQLPEKTLEGIRLFADLETPTKKLLQVILLGQEELRSALDGHSLRALRDRIALSHHLQSLSLQDTEEYIRHRIRSVGGNPAVFSPDCFPIIFEVTRGSPRAINYFCDQCLLFAFGKNQYQLDTALLKEVAARSTRQSNSPVAETAASKSTKSAVMQEVNEEQRPSETVSAGPRTPTATHDEFVALPFRLPSTGHKGRSGVSVDSSTVPETHAPSVLPFKQVLGTLVVGLMVGAVAVWVLVGNGLPISLNFGKRDAVAPMSMGATQGRETVSRAPEPGRAMQPAAMPLNPPIPTPNQSLARISLPSVLDNPSKIKEITIGPTSSLAALASVQYGAWNPTVRDIISESNPMLGDLEKIPDGTRLNLPKLDRGSMVVASEGKRYFIYYGSYESMDMANQDAEALKRLSTSAVVVQGQGAGARISRVFVGPYDNRTDADTVATSLWFKYLPGLN
jgi:type II secretory pathway predicted ATPase ExeA